MYISRVGRRPNLLIRVSRLRSRPEHFEHLSIWDFAMGTRDPNYLFSCVFKKTLLKEPKLFDNYKCQKPKGAPGRPKRAILSLGLGLFLVLDRSRTFFTHTHTNIKQLKIILSATHTHTHTCLCVSVWCALCVLYCFYVSHVILGFSLSASKFASNNPNRLNSVYMATGE